MDRVLRNTSPVVQAVFTVDGSPIDAGSVMATVTRDDGAVLVVGSPATQASAGTYQIPLSMSETGVLDVLSIDWAGTIGGQPQTITTTIEVVGGFLFTIAQAQARSEFNGLSASEIAALRTYAEQELENACGVAFVPRYARTSVFATGDPIGLPHANIRAIRSVTVDGTALAAGDLASVRQVGGYVTFPRWWCSTQVTVSYEHGADFPPAAVTQAALDIAATQVTSSASGIDPRTERIITDDGVLVFGGGGASSFGLPSVDRVISTYALPGV